MVRLCVQYNFSVFAQYEVHISRVLDVRWTCYDLIYGHWIDCYVILVDHWLLSLWGTEGTEGTGSEIF